MIASFKDRATGDLYHGRHTGRVRRFPSDLRGAMGRKLDMLNAAHVLQDLMVLPGNRLERLKGKLRDFHSIRVNDQWRVIFQWRLGNAHSVSITDYHS